jgi:stage V sporulation protein R
MQPDFMSETLKNVYKLWNRPVNIATIMDETPQLFRFDGKEYTQHKLTAEGPTPNPSTEESSGS